MMIYKNLEDLPDIYKESIVEAISVVLSYNLSDIISILLFGSCSRLDIHVGSDIDIAVLTKEKLSDRRLSGGLRADVDDLSTGIRADLVILCEESFHSKDNRLADNIKKDGIVLWKGGAFTNDYKQLLCHSLR